MTHARASLQTMYGLAESAWRLEGDTFQLELNVPANTTASVWLPGATLETLREGGQVLEQTTGVMSARQEGDEVRLELRSGRYHFACSKGS